MLILCLLAFYWYVHYAYKCAPLFERVLDDCECLINKKVEEKIAVARVMATFFPISWMVLVLFLGIGCLWALLHDEP